MKGYKIGYVDTKGRRQMAFFWPPIPMIKNARRAMKVVMDAFHHSYPDCRVLNVERMELSDYEKLIGKS